MFCEIEKTFTSKASECFFSIVVKFLNHYQKVFIGLLQLRVSRMKKKTIRAWIIILFIIGVIVGWLLPGNLSNFTKQISGPMLKPDVFEIPKKFGQLDMEGPYFKYTVLAETETGSIELLRLDDKIPRHLHSNENHFAYVFKGRAKGIIGGVTAEVGHGQLIVIPAGVPHSIERIGDTPVEIILFSTPPFKKEDIVFLDKR